GNQVEQLCAQGRRHLPPRARQWPRTPFGGQHPAAPPRVLETLVASQHVLERTWRHVGAIVAARQQRVQDLRDGHDQRPAACHEPVRCVGRRPVPPLNRQLVAPGTALKPYLVLSGLAVDGADDQVVAARGTLLQQVAAQTWSRYPYPPGRIAEMCEF